MGDLTKPQWAAGVFLARLLIVYDTDAPEQSRPVADELEGLACDELGAEPHPEEQ